MGDVLGRVVLMLGSEATRRRLRRTTRVGAVAFAVGALAYCSLIVGARWMPLPEGFFPPGSTVVDFADNSPAYVFLSPDEKWRIAVSLSEVDPAYLEALIRLEDKRFYEHGGIDVLAVLRAAVSNLTEWRIVSGASTLTMQLVRVREPRPRTLPSKALEAFRSLQLEARFSKKQILEAYLQYVPYGRNIEGIEAASISYFGHRSSNLSASEIATLLAVPQNPNRRYPSSANATRLTQARDEIAEKLAGWGKLPLGPQEARTSEERLLAEIRSQPVPSTLRRFPRHAPHAAHWMRAQQPHALRIETTLDRGTQILVEEHLRSVRRTQEAQRIHNGAAVVVDHRAGEVRALVGSFEFWDEAHGGQIVGFDTPRSPGSALKPFIYAMGIDRGQVLPGFLVLDVPVAYGTYAPQNYDGTHSGLVRMEDALSRSLNVPFVNLLSEMGIERFLGRLRSWGVTSLRDEPGFYGLSAAIGGLEVTPLELAGLYAMLANDGVHRPLRWMRGTKSGTLRALSPGAAFLTRRALSLKDRPDFPTRRRFTGIPPQIHWKTGTSYGHRDAWSAGSDARHTVVVWLGNFDNSASTALVGAEAAGPILFDLLEGLAIKRDVVEEIPPSDLKSLRVCAYSGRAPGPGCPETKTVWARRDAVPTEPCPYHVAVDVDLRSGMALAPGCRDGRNYETRSFLVWPSGLRRYLKGDHFHLPRPPSLAPECPPEVTTPPTIVSPQPNHIALLVPGMAPEDQEIPLTAESVARRLSWFVDGRFLGTVDAQESVWWAPTPGSHEIVVTDEAGRSDRRVLRVARRM